MLSSYTRVVVCECGPECSGNGCVRQSTSERTRVRRRVGVSEDVRGGMCS